MIQDFLGAIASSQSYRRFTDQRPTKTFLYVLFVSLLFTIGSSIVLRIRVGPIIDETFSWLESSTPTLTFAGGKVSSSVDTPTRLTHPKIPDVAIVIDTLRLAPVQLQEMTDAKVVAYLTNNSLYVQERPGELKSYDLSKAGTERPLIIDAKFFRDASALVKTVFYPIAVVIIFLFTAVWVAIAGVLYAVLGLIIGSLTHSSLTFGALYKIAVHAQTAALLFRIIVSCLPFLVPFSSVLTILLTSVYVWLGVRAHAPAPAANP
ncbi:MAG: DUF1189 family protein [Elusimicrobiota bacterium]